MIYVRPVTGAGFVEAGEDNIILAVHGLGKDIRSAGFTLTCQTFPVGPGVKVALNKYDEVYYEQVNIRKHQCYLC
jgi:hypothetical protein